MIIVHPDVRPYTLFTRRHTRALLRSHAHLNATTEVHLRETGLLNQFAQDMLDCQVSLLNILGVRARHRDGNVCYPCQMTALACQSDCTHGCRLRSFQSPHHLRGVAARADTNQDIRRFPKGLYLSLEDAFETTIVGECSQERGVSSQGHCGESGAFEILCKSTDKLGCHMLTIGCAP